MPNPFKPKCGLCRLMKIIVDAADGTLWMICEGCDRNVPSKEEST